MATATRTHAPAPLEERPAMRVLPPRTYAQSSKAIESLLPEGVGR